MNCFHKGRDVAFGALIALAGFAATPAQAQFSNQPQQQDPYLVIQAPTSASRGLPPTTYGSGARTPNYYDDDDLVALGRAPAPATQPVRTVTYADSQPRAATYDVPPASTLATQTGLQLGIQGSYYDYEEHSPSVSLTGGKFGVKAIGTLANQVGFLMADLRYAVGSSDYKGSGSNPDNFEDLWDLRALARHDFIFDNASLSPYIGFGYRQLYSDERGVTSTGFGGYRRTNELFYLPIGVMPRFRIDNDSRIAASLEGDIVLHGNQTSNLSDVSPIYANITNSQTSGYGLRGEVNYEVGRWSLGPFLTYWHLDGTSTSCGQTGFGITCAFEPENHTFEGGAQIRYKLL